MTLPGPSNFPIDTLTLFGAVGPLLTTTASFGWRLTNWKVGGAVANSGGLADLPFLRTKKDVI